MEIRKLWMISLFLLFIMMLGCASASGDFDDVVSYNQSDDQTIQSNDFNEDLSDESCAGSSDNDDAGLNDNILSSENSDEDVGARNGDETLGTTLTYTDLSDSIYANGETTPVELILQNDYVYDNNRDHDILYGGINIKKQVTIHGNGHTIDGRGIFGHFALISESPAHLIIDNLNLVNGSGSGDTARTGSILVSLGTSLTATNCSFDSCSAECGGAILTSAGSSLNFTECTFSNNVATATTGIIMGGGAIYGSPNSLTITNCVFTNNCAPKAGGAIAINGSLVTIKGTTFSGNWLYGSDNAGGAICVEHCQRVTVENSSFTSNRAMNTSDCNGGAVYAKKIPNFNVKNSNFISNEAIVGAALYVLDCGNVKIEDSAIEGNSAFNHSVIYSSSSAHFTFYNSSFADNWARNANIAIAGKTLLNVTDSTFTGNGVSIYGGAIYLNDGPSAVIVGSRFNNNNATCGGAIFTSKTVSSLSITDSSFTGNRAETGAAIDMNSGEIAGTNFTDNHGISGGAIYLRQGCTLSIEDSCFDHNLATVNPLGGYGGAVYANENCILNVKRSNFTGSVALNGSGAIIVFSSDLNVIDSNFNDNEGPCGGAIYATQSTLNVEGSNFTCNVASSEGGAIFAINSDYYLIGSTFTENHARRLGGALYSNSNNVFKVVGSDFNDNYVLEYYGGAICTVNDLSFNISHSAFKRNFVPGVGGAIYALGQNLVMSNDSFNANHASLGAAIYLERGSKMDILKSNFTNQYSVDLGGGAIDARNATLTVSNAIFINNTAKGYGMSVYANTGIIRDSILVDTGIMGNILQSNIQHLSLLEFTIDNIADIVYGDSITLEITGPFMFSGTVNVTVGSNTYYVYINNGAGSKTISDLPAGTYKAILDFHQTDQYYSTYAESNEFHVRYNTSFAIAPISDAVKGVPIVIDVTGANRYTGNVNVVIGSKTYFVSLINGIGSTLVDDLDVGSHKVVIDFQQNDEYTSAHAESNQFSVRYNTTFTFAPIHDVVMGEPIVVNVTEANGYTGDVVVRIGLKSYTVSLADGRGTKSVYDADVGSHTAVIDFSQSGDYTSAHGESNQFSVRYNTTFTFAPIHDVLLGNPIVVNVTEANGYTGDVVVRIGSKSFTLSLSNGKGNRSVYDLDVGSNRAIIEFAQSGDYASAYGESNLFKVRYHPEFVISHIPDSFYGDPISFTITEAHGLNATVAIAVGFFEDSVELKNGMASVNISSIDVGSYIPALDFKGSDTFGPALASGNLFIVKYPSFVDLNKTISAGGIVELDRDYGFDAAYDMQLSGGIPITEDVTINANGHIIDANGLARIFNISNGAHVTLENVTMRNGNAEIGGAILASADSVITVINSTFENNTATGEGSAICSQGVLNVNASSFMNNPSSKASGIYAVGGEIVNSTIIGGGVSGNVHVSDDCVLMIYPLFEIADIPDFVSGSSVTISVSESHGLNGTVEVTIGDETYLVDVENGLGVKTVTPNVSFGKYTASLKFNETKDYYSATVRSNEFQVSINPEIQIADIADAEKGKAFIIKLTANRLFTGKVSVTIGGISYAVDVANGAGSISITPDLKVGEYRAAAKYLGNENYTAANAESNAFRIYSSTQIVSNDVTAVYNDGKYLYVTLKDSDGNAVAGVKLKIEIPKAKSLTPVTDSNGQVKMPLNGISPNTYTAKISFDGNALYAKSAKSVKVIVKKATPKLTASKKTFKKSVKVKKYTITLKDNKGKAMTNAKVTIKIKNKSFSAKVGKNGKATFKITKFNKKGKYTATITYKGDACYNKVSKKVKITIK